MFYLGVEQSLGQMKSLAVSILGCFDAQLDTALSNLD